MSINNNIYSIFGENLKFIRERQNLTLSDMAKLIGYNRNDLSNLEVGKQDIRLSTAVKIAQNLNISFILLISKQFTTIDFLTADNYISEFRDENFLMVFSENLRFILKQQNRTEYSLYSTTEIDPTTISRILNYKSDPKLSTLNSIAQSLSTELKTMFERKM